MTVEFEFLPQNEKCLAAVTGVNKHLIISVHFDKERSTTIYMEMCSQKK